MALTNARTNARPAKDEWGVYDPQQAGLAALYARLDTNAKDPKPAVAAAVASPAPEPPPLPLPRPTLRDAQ
jgi:hypothetical protein